MEQSITNGFVQTIVQAQPNTLGGFIYSRNTYNELGQLTQQNVDGQAPVLYAYDAMWNVCRQTVLLDAAAPEDATRNRILNRPVRFESADGSTIITADYDYMGRSVFKKVESVNEGTTTTTTSHLRFLYRGYLQIAALDLTRPSLNAMWFITWDVTQPVATRPLAIQKDGTWYTYGWDLTKNICEVYANNGYIATTYSYTPYGSVTANGYADQPIQWSSEYNDTELGLVYYNYRHYNHVDGRWIGRDIAKEAQNERYGKCYNFARDNALFIYDYLGGWDVEIHRQMVAESFDDLNEQGFFSNLKYPDAYRDALKHGSTLPDIPINTWKCAMPWHFAYRLHLLYSSHYGNRQWWHAMNPGGLTSPAQIRNNIIDELLRLKKQKQEKNIIYPLELGFVLHMIEDSYSHAHAVRDEQYKIIQYNNYSEQDADIEHKPYDSMQPEAFEHMPDKIAQMERQRKLYNRAQLATKQVMIALLDCKVSEEELKRLIEEEIMPHAKTVK